MQSKLREREARVGSFISVCVPSPAPSNRVISNNAPELIRRYCHHLVKSKGITFEEAACWIGNDPRIDTLRPTETRCFHCDGPLVVTVHTARLFTLSGERTIKSEKRSCGRCQFKFRHTDLSSGIMMHGQHAYHISLMVHMDNNLRRQGNFALFWNVSPLKHYNNRTLNSARVSKIPMVFQLVVIPL